MRSLLSGSQCWDACEAAARAKRPKLGPEYRICSIESFPQDVMPGFSRAEVRLGERLTRANGAIVWIGITNIIDLTAEEVEEAAKKESDHERVGNYTLGR